MMCGHHLGSLPCTNPKPHAGSGHGCTHDAGTGIPNAPKEEW